MRCAAVLALALLAASSAHAEPAPCDGCLFVPARGEHRPLVVLLHGDGQSAAAMLRAFRATGAARDVALFAIACPPARGCDAQSFWRWNADAHWIADHATALVERHHLDPARVWLVGWSGGAVYASFHLRELVAPFAAVALLGGGGLDGRCARRKVPVFMLSSELNPYQPIIERTREHLEGCGHPVVHEGMPKRDHDDAWKRVASPAFQDKLFDWLAGHPLTLSARLDAID